MTSKGANPSSPHERFDARLQRRSAAVLKSRILQSEKTAIDSALEDLRADGAVERASALIVRARRRFILGSGKSFGYAALLSADMNASLTHVTLIDSTIVRPIDVLSDVRATDVMVVFSMRRYRRDTIDIARSFVAAGGALVVVTDSEEAPLADVATELVLVKTDSASYTDSSLAVVVVLHLLASLATASAKGAGRRLKERDRLSAQLNLYVGD